MRYIYTAACGGHPINWVMLHDVVQRDMDSYGLKAAAKYFGPGREDRT